MFHLVKGGAVRLQNGKDPEIFWNGKWAPICGHFFWDNNNGAKLFCQKMGFTYGKVKGQGSQSLLTDDAIRIGGCSDSDNQLFGCTGGCNDLKVGGHCTNNDGAVCTKGQSTKVEIECGMLTVLQGYFDHGVWELTLKYPKERDFNSNPLGFWWSGKII